MEFGKLIRSHASKYSFVGIQDGKFYVPIGISNDTDSVKSSYDENKKLFFLLYRTLRKFIKRLDKTKVNKYSAVDRDGVGKHSAKKTFTIETEDGAEEVLYTRLSGIDDVLEGFDELRLFALRERMRSSDEIDYSQIHRYLDKAMYLSNGTIYIDQMQIAKPTLNYHTTDLVRMCCYIYREIKCELKEDNDIGLAVATEAENFQENHLSPDDSLFGEHTHARTRDLLREQLERIGEQTAFKDDAYWHFYEAIEAILYPQNRKSGDDGTYWGINKFWPVWEDMCQEKVKKETNYEVLYADRLGGLKTKGEEEIWRKAFTFTGPEAKYESQIRPDLILEGVLEPCEGDKDEQGFSIIDFKYKEEPDDDDLRKQCIYEYAVENAKEELTHSLSTEINKDGNLVLQNVCVMPRTPQYPDENNGGISKVFWPFDEVMNAYIGSKYE